MNYYIADWHYGHTNCIAFDGRPFKSRDHMNAELIRRWNEVVKNDDQVYILGDMFWCNPKDAIPVLDALNGQKFLVKGNHDRCHNQEFASRFVSINDYMEINDNGRNVILSHYPIPCFKNHFYGWYHLYGHVHTSFEHNMMMHHRYLIEELYSKQCKMYNVGAMLPYMDYTPQTLDTILYDGGVYYQKNFCTKGVNTNDEDMQCN